MEHGAGKCVQERTHTEVTIKIEVEEAVSSTGYVDIEINVDRIKEEPGLSELVENEPELLVKEENLEDSKQDNAALVHCNDIKSVVGVVQPLEIHSCDRCKKTFKTKASLRSHLTSIHAKSQFICSECNKQFKCQRYLSHHIAYVHSPQHKCEICDKPFKCSKLLANHIKFVHGNKIIDSSGLFVCNYCLEKFCRERELMSHLQNMHASKSCKCKACKTSFRLQQFRLRHNDKVDGSEENKRQTYKCDKCLKVYKSKESLWHHSKRVHGTGSHKCTQCEKEFKCESYLLKHVQYTHSEEQYECEICKTVCISRAGLSRHVECFHRPKFSDPEKSHSCDKCVKTFQSQIALMRHYKFVHGAERYKCEQCKKDYKCKVYLMNHINEAHSNKQFVCDICKKIFKSRRAVDGHIRVHSRRIPAAAMERGAGECVKEKTQTKMTLKTEAKEAALSSAYVEIEIDIDRIKEEPGLLKLDKNEPVIFVKEEILEDSEEVVTSAAVSTSTQQLGAAAVKSEPADAELELG